MQKTSNTAPSSIGILDWGIGGMGFYRALRERYSDIPIHYLSDSGSTPYGRLSRMELRRRMALVFGYFTEHGVRHLVVACNAASTVLMNMKEHDCGGGETLSIIGVIEPAVKGVLRNAARSLGVIGGERTIRSGVYRRLLSAHVPVILQRVAQPLSALIERGDSGSQTMKESIARIMAPLRAVDTLLLACTHYAAIAPLLQEGVPAAALVDPVPELLDWTESAWGLSSWRGNGEERFTTTGNPAAMRHAAAVAFSIPIDRVESVTLPPAGISD